MQNVFDKSKAYRLQGKVYSNDGREAALLRHILSRSDLDSLRGSPDRVLAAIDEFGREEKYMMNIGSEKGAHVTNVILKARPSVMVELGSYVGYSAILFSNALRSIGGRQYLCLESNAEFAAIARALIDLAGLSALVQVIVGTGSDSLHELHSSGKLRELDILFLDHHKPLYVTDLKLCEQLGLIKKGVIIVADNVIKPGNPAYLEYVRSDVRSKLLAHDAGNVAAACDDDDGGVASVLGDPHLVYESELIHSFEPTGTADGIEMTRCIGRDVLE